MDKAAHLFQPDQGILRTKGIVMADTIVMPGKTVTLLVNNFGCEPVQLERGGGGQLEAATVIDTSPETNEPEVHGSPRAEASGEVSDVMAIQ